MEWFDRRHDEYLKEKQGQESIAQFADSVYGDLWSSIKEVAMRANQRGFQLRFNGTERHNVVIMGQKNLRIDLSEDKRSITVSGVESTAHFNLAACEDRVCLQHDGKSVSSAEAARVLMEPFIFGHVASEK